MKNELEEYIKIFFGIVQQKDIKAITSLFQLKTLKKGEKFLVSGKIANKLCFVQSGFLRQYSSTDKKEITQWISSKGYFAVDLSSFIFETHSRWDIQALVETEIYTISKTDYNNISKIVPQWNHLEKLFITKCFGMMEDRIFSHLSLTAEERYNLFFEHNRKIFNQVPLQYIASMLGMTPETLSRIRKKQIG